MIRLLIQKEECFVECTKPPVLHKAKPGAQAQYVMSLINPHAKCLSTTRNETEVLDLAVGRLYTRSTAKVDSFLGLQPV